MKYELLEWYLFLPQKWKGKEGLVVEKIENHELYHLPSKPLGVGVRIPAKEVENNPQFWKKKPQKDYEILKTRIPSYEIYSVKRLSDNKIFSLRNRVKARPDMKTFEIRKIKEDNGQIFVYGPDEVPFIQKAHLKDIKQVFPLFTTEDGHKIYKGDKYWYVYRLPSGRYEYKFSYAVKHSKWKRNKSNKYFKYKENAKKWIENHD